MASRRDLAAILPRRFRGAFPRMFVSIAKMPDAWRHARRAQLFAQNSAAFSSSQMYATAARIAWWRARLAWWNATRRTVARSNARSAMTVSGKGCNPRAPQRAPRNPLNLANLMTCERKRKREWKGWRAWASPPRFCITQWIQGWAKLTQYSSRAAIRAATICRRSLKFPQFTCARDGLLPQSQELWL